MAPGLAIIIPTRPSGRSDDSCDEARDRLSSQLTQIGIPRVVALESGTVAAQLRAVARLLREQDGPVVVTAGDIMVHTAALDSAVIPGGTTTRVLVARRSTPDGSRPGRVER